LFLLPAVVRPVSAHHAIAFSDPAAARADGASVPPPTRVQVDIIFDGPPMPPKVEASVMAELTGIWSQYGVDIHRSCASELRREGVVRLVVLFSDKPDPNLAKGTLGTIRFRDAVPEPVIVIYPRTIASTISSVTLNGVTERGWPTAFRDLVVGRVMGRALAHEIGHYLLRMRYHSSNGLMKVAWPAPDLAGADRYRFRLSKIEVTRLESITSAAASSSPAAARADGRSDAWR
jgi:hypothetical protein